MAIAAEIKAPQAETLAVYNVPAFSIKAGYAGVNAVFRQAADIEVSQATLRAAFRQTAKIRITQAQVLAVVRGRAQDPRVRAWTFTLDGHDFYVLRLGDTETLLYDAYSEQWIEWTTGTFPFWRANTGIAWIGAEALAYNYGSSVVAGDDTLGLLWFLDPDQPFDESADYTEENQQVAFPRIVTGQVLASGRQYIPCYVIFVDGDNYGLTATEFVPAVTLEYSDDQGRNFISAETLNAEADITVDNPYAWYSLGQIASPGRIFRVTDNGVFARIDNMDMNDDAG